MTESFTCSRSENLAATRSRSCSMLRLMIPYLCRTQKYRRAGQSEHSDGDRLAQFPRFVETKWRDAAGRRGFRGDPATSSEDTPQRSLRSDPCESWLTLRP